MLEASDLLNVFAFAIVAEQEKRQIGNRPPERQIATEKIKLSRHQKKNYADEKQMLDPQQIFQEVAIEEGHKQKPERKRRCEKVQTRVAEIPIPKQVRQYNKYNIRQHKCLKGGLPAPVGLF